MIIGIIFFTSNNNPISAKKYINASETSIRINNFLDPFSNNFILSMVNFIYSY